MKLSQETIAILKNFATINNSIFIDEASTLKTQTPGSTNIIGVADISEEFPEVAIYSLNEFVGAMSLLGAGEIEAEIDEGNIKLAGEGAKVNYRLSDPSHVTNRCKESSRYKDYDDFNFIFNLSANEISNIQKAARVMGLDVLQLSMEDGEGKAKLISNKNPLASNYEITISGSGSGSCKVLVNNLLMIPGDYTVSVSEGRTIKVEKTDFPIFYFISVLAD